MTEVPPETYAYLLQPVQKENCTNTYENMDMTVISILLRLLDLKLEYKIDLIENLSPILSCSLKLAKKERLIRKFMRLEVF